MTHYNPVAAAMRDRFITIPLTGVHMVLPGHVRDFPSPMGADRVAPPTEPKKARPVNIRVNWFLIGVMGLPICWYIPWYMGG